MRRELQNLFNRTFYVVEHNREQNIIDTLWYGYASKNDLKKACSVGLELLEEVKCPYKLNDNSQFTGPWSDAITWLEEEWLPRAMKAGVKYLAHVASSNSFGEHAGEVMQISKIGQNLEVCIFDNRDKALEWLRSCQQKHHALN